MRRPPTAVNRIVAAALDSAVEDCSVPEEGAIADTYLLTLADGTRVVCKLGGESVWTEDVVEPCVLRLVRRETSLSVPDVLASGLIEGTSGPKRWGLYEFCPGTVPDVRTVATYEQVVSEAGAALARLHTAFSFEQIGGFVRDDQNDLDLVEPTDWNLRGSPIVDRVSTAVTSQQLRRPVLAHGDYRPGNLLVDDGSITAILDWANSHVTSAGYSLARAETRFVDVPPVAAKHRLRRAFRDGYRRHASIPSSYTEAVRFYRALWVAQSCVNVCKVTRTERGRIQLSRQLHNWFTDDVRSLLNSSGAIASTESAISELVKSLKQG